MATTTTKPKAPPQLVLEFDYERATTNATRFAQADVPDGQRAEVGTFYLTKKAIVDTGLKAKRLRITIEDAD